MYKHVCRRAVSKIKKWECALCDALHFCKKNVLNKSAQFKKLELIPKLREKCMLHKILHRVLMQEKLWQNDFKIFWMSGPPLLAHALTSVSLLVLYQWRHYKIRRACEQSGKWRSPKNCFEGNVWRECLVQRKGQRNNRQISWSFCLLQKWSFKLRDLRKPMVPHLALITFYTYLHLLVVDFFAPDKSSVGWIHKWFFGSLGSTPKKWPGEFWRDFSTTKWCSFQGPALCGRPQGAWGSDSLEVLVEMWWSKMKPQGVKPTGVKFLRFMSSLFIASTGSIQLGRLLQQHLLQGRGT